GVEPVPRHTCAGRRKRRGKRDMTFDAAADGNKRRATNAAGGLALFAALLLGAGCQTATGPLGEVAAIDSAQGSSENISSLTAVINRSPNDAEAYNVRGAAYGRGGRYQEALKDFDTAIRINPNFYQAYANRALIHRFMGNQQAALQDYDRSLQLNANY